MLSVIHNIVEMTRSRFAFTAEQNTQPQAALLLPPSLEQLSVSPKKHPPPLNGKRLANFDSLTMRKCFLALGHKIIIIIRMVSYIPLGVKCPDQRM